jgi:hypothetical protein
VREFVQEPVRAVAKHQLVVAQLGHGSLESSYRAVGFSSQAALLVAATHARGPRRMPPSRAHHSCSVWLDDGVPTIGWVRGLQFGEHRGSFFLPALVHPWRARADGDRVALRLVEWPACLEVGTVIETVGLL